FRNTTQKPMDGNIPDTPPVVVLPSQEDVPRWDALRSEVADARNRARQLHDGAADAFSAWLAAKPELTNPLDAAPEWATVSNATAKGVTTGEGPDAATPGLHFTGKSTLDMPAPEQIDIDKPFTVAAWVYLSKSEDNVTVAGQFTRNEKNDDGDEETAGKGWK